MHDPSQGRFHKGKIVFRDDGFDDAEGVESRVFEISLAVKRSYGVRHVAVPTRGWDFAGLVFSTEEAAGERVVDDNFETVATACRDELGLDRTGFSNQIKSGSPASVR